MFNINELYSSRIEKNYLNNKLRLLDNVLEFNKACAAYLRVEHNLDLDYKNEVMYCEGIKDIFNMLSIAFIDKDDYIIDTIPSYTIMSNIPKWAGANIYNYPLHKFNKGLVDFEEIEENILKKCKLLYINYPNNPTGAVANKDFFKEVVKYAKKYKFIVIHDASYINFCFEDIDKVSFLSVEGAKDIGIELYNVNQANFIAGNKDIIKTFQLIKENFASNSITINSNVFNNYEEINKKLKEMYLRRHKSMKEVLDKHGFQSELPKAGFYKYISIPKSCNGVTFESAEEFAYWLIENVQINVNPHDSDGKYISLSLSFLANDEEEKQIINELDERLSKYKFEF